MELMLFFERLETELNNSFEFKVQQRRYILSSTCNFPARASFKTGSLLIARPTSPFQACLPSLRTVLFTWTSLGPSVLPPATG